MPLGVRLNDFACPPQGGSHEAYVKVRQAFEARLRLIWGRETSVDLAWRDGMFGSLMLFGVFLLRCRFF